jgi:hypothetical protein
MDKIDETYFWIFLCAGVITLIVATPFTVTTTQYPIYREVMSNDYRGAAVSTTGHHFDAEYLSCAPTAYAYCEDLRGGTGRWYNLKIKKISYWYGIISFETIMGGD